jgi:hypothetical protein
MDDLRLLEAPNQSNPAYDLVAAYARQTKTDLELRFDLLGSPAPVSYDLYVALDTGPGGGGRLPFDLSTTLDWDVLLRYPAAGLSSAVSADGRLLHGIRPRIIRDGQIDTITVRLSSRELPIDRKVLSFQAFLVRRGETMLADTIGPARLNGPAIAKRAPTYLVFWDTLPSETPAIALRRWDGAHTGPFGQRHGLSVLLQASSQAGIPVTLLDLARADRLAAIDALGGLDGLRKLTRNGLVSIPAWGVQDTLSGSSAAARAFRLSTSKYAYGLITDGLPDLYKGVFARQKDTTHLILWNQTRVVPLPADQTVTSGGEASQGEDLIATGLAVETRTALLSAALSPDPADLVALGGSLPGSPWGDQSIAAPAFAYLAGHPWIHVLSAGDLLSFPAQSGQPDCPDLLCENGATASAAGVVNFSKQVQQAPDGFFAGLARQAYHELTDPVPDPRLTELRAGYVGTVTGPLLAAARWEANPRPQAGCADDIDADGMPECILASDQIFAVLDPQGARLTLLAMRKAGRVFEIAGQRSQLAVGLGDPSTWTSDPGRGDPQDIPGAFTDPANPWKLHQVEVSPDAITFIDPETSAMAAPASITYRLEDHALRIEIQPAGPITTSIPLLLLSPATYAPGGYNRYQPGPMDDPTRWTWSMRGGPSVEIHAEGGTLAPTDFTSILSLLKSPENPDKQYPPGFYLPFPMSVVELTAPGPCEVILSLK